MNVRSLLWVAMASLLMLLSAVGCGSSGSSPSPTTYVSVEYGISFAIPAGFSPSKIEVSPSLGSLRQIGEWRNPDTKTQMGLFVMDASGEKDPRERVMLTIEGVMADVLKTKGISIKRSFSWVDAHPAYVYSATDPADPEHGRIVEAAIAGKPFAYLLLLNRHAADDHDLTGATAESLLASMRFSGEEAKWRIDPTGYTTYRDRSNGYSLKYPDRFLLGGSAKSGSGYTLGIVDAASPSSFAPDNSAGFLAIRAEKNPRRLTQGEVRSFVGRVLDSGTSRKVMGFIVSDGLTSGSKLLSVSQPRELQGYGAPGMDAEVTLRTSSNKTERIRAYLLVTPTHLLAIWLHPGGDVQSLVRIVRSIRAVD